MNSGASGAVYLIMLRAGRLSCFISVSLVVASPGAAGSSPRPGQQPESPPLVILSGTGEERDGLPVVAPHPDPDPYLSALTRGYSGRVLRLYGLAQQCAHPDRARQPAYLVLTGNQGGFPRLGFHDGAYRRAAAARWSVAPKARMTFPLWFSGAEQVLRYHAVRDDLFSREPDIPAHVYARDAYTAYLLDNTLPGEPTAAARPLGRLLATEGVIAAFVYRMVNAPAIQAVDRDDAFYRRFGTTRGEIDDLENAYLKLFAAVQQGGYDIAAVAAAYGGLFPNERAVVLFGLPGGLAALWRSRSPAHAARVSAAWLCAALPAALAVTPLG